MENGNITILAPAKINLYFGVTGIRADGYHEIETVLQTVNLFDRITVAVSEGEGRQISVLCRELADLPQEKNLAYKAAEAFLSAADDENIRVEISIEKKIPDKAGFGGGSSDAAAVIIALNTLSGDRFSMAELFGIGASVGADVPFCIKRAPSRRRASEKCLKAALPCRIAVFFLPCRTGRKRRRRRRMPR
ncbi:MAG: hypothetical protein V8S82_03860 [Eubacteriales bacterium]